MTAAPFAQTYVRRTPNPALLALIAMMFVGAAGVAVWGAVTDNFLGIASVHLTLLAMAALAMLFRHRPLAKHAPVEVRVDRERLTVGDTVVSREAITRAWIVPPSARGESYVRIERRVWPAVELLIDHHDEGQRLLEALGHDVGSRSLQVTALSRAMASPWRILALLGSVVAGLTLSMFMASLGVPLPILPLLVLVAMWAVPSRVHVGADGVLIRWLGTARFVPASQIAFTERYESGIGRNRIMGVRVHLTAGAPLLIPVGNGGASFDEAEALAARIDEVRERHRAGIDAHEAARLTRGDRTADDWLRALRAVGVGATESFRHHDLDREALWRVFESAASSPESRAAAAAALTARRDDRDAERVRVVAHAVVEPTLRTALEAAADHDDAALARGLDALTQRKR